MAIPVAQRLAATLASLPHAPGVYLMKGRRGEVFYIGKAKSLRDRVRGYFSGSDTRAFVALLDVWLIDLEVILTHSEKEALLLENELIKAHRPRFNVKLTDDKRFLCLRLDTKQNYPRLQVTRKFGRDGARYFGPYHSASAIRDTLKLVNRHFQLRTCTDQVLNNRSRPCLQYQIKRCPAPCVFDLTDGRYSENVRDVAAFLEGRHKELVASLNLRMAAHAEAMEFEAAGALRDQIKAINRSLERQRIITSDFINRDVLGCYREGPTVELHVMRTRSGRLIDAKRFSLSDLEQPTSDIIADFLGRFYTSEADLPDELVLCEATDWSEALADVLSERRGQAVRVTVPQRGDKKLLVDLANRNAHQAFLDQQRERGAAKTAVERLQTALHLRHLPQRIECVDISHTMGTHIVASVISFLGGVPHKPGYRHYKVKSLTDQDDFKSMYEIVSRRVRRGLAQDDLPDLLVIDGGKGQLAAARAALNDHQVVNIDLISLAKSRLLSKTTERYLQDGPNSPQSPEAGSALRSPERVFVHGHKNPIVLRQNSAELFLLVRARDEAHRFAISFHRRLKRNAATHSILENISGLGPVRRKTLLRHFGSVTRIRMASIEDISKVVGPKLAGAIDKMLKNPNHDAGPKKAEKSE